MKEIRSIIGIDKPLHIQVTASDTDGMLRDADTLLNKVDSKVYIKIPVTMEGMKTIKLLKAQNLHVTGTAIYSKQQGSLLWKQAPTVLPHTLIVWKIWASTLMMLLLLSLK